MSSVLFTLFFISCSYTFFCQKKWYSPVRISSSILHTSISPDSITFKSKFYTNFAIGLGYLFPTDKEIKFAVELNAQNENYEFSSDPKDFSDCYRIRLYSWAFNVKALLVYNLSKNFSSKLGFSNGVVMPYKYSTQQISANSTVYYSPAFDKNFQAKYDLKGHLSFDIRPDPDKQYSLGFGVETSVLKNYLYFDVLRISGTEPAGYKMKYFVIQPFLCVSYYW